MKSCLIHLAWVRIMLSKSGIYIAAAIMVLTPLISAAQTGSGFQPGERKFTVIRTGLNNGKLDRTGLGSSWSIDRFLNLEKVVRQDGSFINIPDDRDWNDSPRVIANYYFGSDAWVPLVGLSMGYIRDPEEDDRFVAGSEIGIKYFMNQTTFLYGLLEYQFHINDVVDVRDIYENGRFVYGVGLGLTFSY